MHYKFLSNSKLLTTFSKLILYSFFFVFFSISAKSQNQQIRVRNVNNPTQTFVYNLTFDAQTNLTINRTIDNSIATDIDGTYIVGAGWTFNLGNINLPINLGLNWYKIDANFNGGYSMVVNSSITITCPCASSLGTGNCDAKAQGTCVKCDTNTNCANCGAPTSSGFSIPILVNAKSVTLNF